MSSGLIMTKILFLTQSWPKKSNYNHVDSYGHGKNILKYTNSTTLNTNLKTRFRIWPFVISTFLSDKLWFFITRLKREVPFDLNLYVEYIIDSPPYVPYEVQVSARNRIGEGPRSPLVIVYTAEGSKLVDFTKKKH